MGEPETVTILRVKKDNTTGRPVFLAKRSSGGKEKETWEMSDTLEVGKCNVFLILRGYKELGANGLLERVEGSEGDDDLPEPSKVKKLKKEQYVLSTKKAKPAPETPQRPVQIPKGVTSLSRSLSAAPAIRFPPKAMKTAPVSKPGKQPTPPPSTSVSFPSSPEKSLQSASTPSKSESRVTAQTPPALPLFGNMKSRQGIWDKDRPVKVLGCREGPEGLEYAVLFASDTSELLHYQIVTHGELLTKAPWLFSRFFVTNIKVESK